MKKIIITSCLLGSAFLILDRFDFFNSFLLFLLVGEVPGTKYSLSPMLMLALVLGVLGVGVFHATFTRLTTRLR